MSYQKIHTQANKPDPNTFTQNMFSLCFQVFVSDVKTFLKCLCDIFICVCVVATEMNPYRASCYLFSASSLFIFFGFFSPTIWSVSSVASRESEDFGLGEQLVRMLSKKSSLRFDLYKKPLAEEKERRCFAMIVPPRVKLSVLVASAWTG